MNIINEPIDQYYTNKGYGGNKDLKNPLQSLSYYRMKVDEKIKLKQKIFLPLKTIPNQILDYKEYIYQQRQILENIKETQYEKDFNNLYVERQKKQKLKEQREEMRYLINKYKNSIFSFILENSDKVIQQKQREDILEKEGELIEFEKTALNQIEQIERIEQLRLSNDELRDDIRTSINLEDEDLKLSISNVSTQEELEEAKNFFDDVMSVRSSLNSIGDTSENESVDLEKPLGSAQTYLGEYGFLINKQEQKVVGKTLTNEERQELRKKQGLEEAKRRNEKLKKQEQKLIERGQKIQESRTENLKVEQDKLMSFYENNEDKILDLKLNFEKIQPFKKLSEMSPQEVMKRIDYLSEFLPPADIDSLRIRFGGRKEKNKMFLDDFNKELSDFRKKEIYPFKGLQLKDFEKQNIKNIKQISKLDELRKLIKKKFSDNL